MSDVKNFNSSNEILLLDSSIPKSELIKLITEHSSKFIITFDYDTHNFLEYNKIKHIVSDEFVSDDDLENIQSQVYHFVNWYNDENISSFLEYEKINIGKLMSDEILDYLVKFLKTFWEIKRICDSNKSASFFAPSTIYEIGKKFSNSFNLIRMSKTENIFAHDKVRLNFKLGNKYFMHHISKSSYKKFKNIFEKITNYMLSSKFKQNCTHSVLVEFNTLKYQDLLLDSKLSSVQFLFYGRRRPAMWNLKSYSIMKNSNCEIFNYHKLEDKQFSANVNKNYNNIKDNLNKLWKNNNFFSTFFTFEGISFWNVISFAFIDLFEKRLESIIHETELAKQFFSHYKFDNILVLSEIGFIEQIIISIAKSKNIPVILIQHGLIWNTPEANSMNLSQGGYPILSDFFIPYGEIEKLDALNNAKINKNKLKILACPIYNNIDPASSEDKNYVLLTTTGPQPESVYGLSTKNIEEYKNTIKKICEISVKHNFQLIIKPHPSPTELEIFDIVKEINPKISVVTTGNVFDLIKSCKFMINIGVSSVILEAQIFQKPVIALPGIDYKWGHPEIFDSCLFSNISTIESDILELFSNTTLKNEIIQKGNTFLKKYISNFGNGTNQILNFLKTIN